MAIVSVCSSIATKLVIVTFSFAGEPCEQVGRLRGRKRKDRDDEEGKPVKRKRQPDFDSNEHDSAEADMSRISRKRKFSADGREEREKKRRVVEMKTRDASGDNPRGE